MFPTPLFDLTSDGDDEASNGGNWPGYPSVQANHPILISDHDEPQPNNPAPAAGPSADPTFELFSAAECVQLIRNILPDISVSYLEKLVCEQNAQTPAACERLIAILLEEPTYPKQSDSLTGVKRKRSGTDEEEESRIAKFSTFPARRGYANNALAILQDHFPAISCRHIKEILGQEKTFYATYNYLEKQRREGSAPPIHKPRLTSQIIIDGKLAASPDIAEELQAAKAKNDEAAEKEAEKNRQAEAKERAEEENLLEARRDGSMSDCSCCFGENPVNRMISCSGDALHFFCHTCVTSFLNTEMGKTRCEPVCFALSGSEPRCSGTFTRAQLMSALDPKTFERLENMQQQDNIEAAGLDLAECPFCDFKADCELVKDDKELRCLNPKCAKTSCRLCDEETHIPMSCEEASKKKKHISARQKVEEAKSEALIRQCNRCKRKFIKDAGCNKMTCPKCGNTQCYVCGKDVRGYNHFDGGCPLQDNGGVRHIEDVQKAEARAVAEVRAIHPDLSDADLGVDPATRAKEAETAVGDGMEERRRLQAQVRAQARMLGLQARERLAVPPIPFFERPLAFDYPLYPVGAGNQQGPQTIGGGFNGAFPGIPHYVEQLFRPIPNPEQPVRQAIEQPLAQPPPQFLRPFLPYQWEQAGQQQIGQPPQPMPQLIPQYVGQPNQQNMAQLHQENMAQHHQPDMARQIQEQHQQVQLLFAEEARQHFPPQPTDPFQQQLGNMFYPF